MTRPTFAIAACLALLLVGAAPQGDARRADLHDSLQRTLARLSSELEGVSGYVIRDPATEEMFERNGDVVFPVASVIKVPVFLELLRQSEEGSLDLAGTVAIDPKARVEGGGVLEKWSEPYPDLSARQLAVLMIDFSDNYATNLLIDRVGLERVGTRLKGWGLKETQLRRKMMDLEAARAGRENVSTPREMATLLERLQRGDLLNAGDTRWAIDVLKRNERTPIKIGLPPGIEAADKDGELEGVRCDAGIVYVPGAAGAAAARRPFLIAVMTSYLKDDAAGESYVSAVARAACEHFRTLALSSEYGRRIEALAAPAPP